METTKKRIEYIDIAKGLAIIAVVLGHALTDQENVSEITHPRLLNWISFFNVSTFFMINGFLYSDKCAEHPFRSILKKFKAYYLPYLAFNLIFYVLNNPLVNIHFLSEGKKITGVSAFIKGLISLFLGKMQPLTGPMWFLRALIVMSVLYILIDSVSSRLFNGKHRYVINGAFSVLMLLASALLHLPNTFNIDSGCKYFLVYFAGVLYRRFNLNRFMKKRPVAAFAVAFVLSVILANVTNVGLYFNSNYPLAFLALFISVTMILSASQLPFISKAAVIKLAGQSSLYIMALHFFAFKFVSLAMVKLYGFEIMKLEDIPVIRELDYSGLWTVIYVLVGVAVPVCIAKLVEMIRKRIGK